MVSIGESKQRKNTGNKEFEDMSDDDRMCVRVREG